MPHVILKRLYDYSNSGKRKRFWTIHTTNSTLCGDLAKHLNAQITPLKEKSNETPTFELDKTGHFAAQLTGDFSKAFEEDFLVIILDAMENLGYTVTKQYDKEELPCRYEVFIFSSKKK
jgi:hypothetical protein